MYLNVVGRSLLILDNLNDAIELLDKRSAIYSSRLELNMIKMWVKYVQSNHDASLINCRTGWEWNLAFLPYGQGWRRQRRMIWQHFHPGAIRKYENIEQEGARKFLIRLLESPNNLLTHVR